MLIAGIKYNVMFLFVLIAVLYSVNQQQFSVWASFTALRGSYDPAVIFCRQLRGVVRPARGICGPKRELLVNQYHCVFTRKKTLSISSLYVLNRIDTIRSGVNVYYWKSKHYLVSGYQDDSETEKRLTAWFVKVLIQLSLYMETIQFIFLKKVKLPIMQTYT